jgi:hypothetical protein
MHISHLLLADLQIAAHNFLSTLKLLKFHVDLLLHLKSILLQNLSFIIPYMEHPQGVGLADCGDHSSDPWQPICMGNFSSVKSTAP